MPCAHDACQTVIRDFTKTLRSDGFVTIAGRKGASLSLTDDLAGNNEYVTVLRLVVDVGLLNNGDQVGTGCDFTDSLYCEDLNVVHAPRS